jgi:hypothetical protein
VSQFEAFLALYSQTAAGRRKDKVSAARDLARFLDARGLGLDTRSLLNWLQSKLPHSVLECLMMDLVAVRPFLQFLARRGVCAEGLWAELGARPDLLQLLEGPRSYDSRQFPHTQDWQQLLLDFEDDLRGLAPLTQARMLRVASGFGALLQERELDTADRDEFLGWLDGRLRCCGVDTVFMQVLMLGRFCAFLVRRGRCTSNPVLDWRRSHGVTLLEALRLRQQGEPIPGRPPQFQSFLTAALEAFVAFKRNLGRKYQRPHHLIQLDRFLRERAIRVLDSATLNSFVASLTCKASTRQNVVGELKQFLRFLRRRDLIAQDLGETLPRVVRAPRLSYIFTLRARHEIK